MTKLSCPTCDKSMHPVCSNLDCVCHKRIPEGELPMIERGEVFGIRLPKKLFNKLWVLSYKLKLRPWRFMIELEECPYCRYANTYDYWEDRDMEQAENERLRLPLDI